MASNDLAPNNIIIRSLAGLIPMVIGLVVMASSLRNLRRPAGYLLILSLAPGFGLAITSVIYFFWIYFYQPQFAINRYLTLEGLLSAILILGCGAWWITSRRKLPTVRQKEKPARMRFNFSLGISITGAVILFLAFITFLNNWQISAYENPDGHWDAKAIWNLRARFIFSGEQWKDGFDTAIRWSHPDYPLLLPGSIARIWVMQGSRTQVVPMIINLLFTLSILAVMLAGIAHRRGWKTAIFAGLFTLPVLQVSLRFMQYADMPLAFFFLSANIFLFMADTHRTVPIPPEQGEKKSGWRIMLPNFSHKVEEISTKNSVSPIKVENFSVFLLVGLAAGAALWTKDEGWALLVGIVAGEILWILVNRWTFRNDLKRWAFFFIGLFPMLTAVWIYKRMVDIPINLFTAILNENIMLKLTDLSRYWLIGKAFLQQFYTYGTLHLPLLPLMVIYLLVVGINIQKHERFAILTLAMRVGIIGLIYFAIYLLTPSSLEWHLKSSLTRLVSQLLPSIILIVFLCGRSLEDIAPKSSEIVQADPQGFS